MVRCLAEGVDFFGGFCERIQNSGQYHTPVIYLPIIMMLISIRIVVSW